MSSGPRPPSIARGNTKPARRPFPANRIAVALLSATVLIGVGYAWYQLTSLHSGLTTADVLDHSAAVADPMGAQNILLVGLDSRTDAQGNPLPQAVLDQLHAGGSSDGGDNTDTMILVHVPAGGHSAVAFSIPRDSYVQITGGFGQHKINSAYTRAEVATAATLRARGENGPALNVAAAQAGAKSAVDTVQGLTGLTVTHFASVNLAGFYAISQAVGGVPVCLNQRVNDPYSGASFPAGQQTVAGAQALAFVRQRHGLPGGDLDRIRRQQAFLASMARTVLSGEVLTDPAKLSALVEAIKQSVVLDQGWDVLGFARQARAMSAGGIAFQTIPVGTAALRTPEDGDAIQVDPAQVRAAITAAVAAADGTTSPTTPGPTSAPSPSTAPAAVVDVANGTTTAGLAAQVRRTLEDSGYHPGTLSTIGSRTRTEVGYPKGDQQQARALAARLGPQVPTIAEHGLGQGHLEVLLGRDYTSAVPATTPPAAPPPATPPVTSAGVTCVN